MAKKKRPPTPFNHVMGVPGFVPSCGDLEVFTDEFMQYIIEVRKSTTNKERLNEYIQTCASGLLTAWYELQRVLIISSNAELSVSDAELNEWKQVESLLESHGMLMDDNMRAIMFSKIATGHHQTKLATENGNLHKGHTAKKAIMVQAWKDWRANPDKSVIIEGKEYPIAGISSNKQGTGFDDVLAKVCGASVRTIENWRREAGLTK